MRRWSRNLLIGLSIVCAGDGISRGAGQSRRVSGVTPADPPHHCNGLVADRSPFAAKRTPPMTAPTKEQILMIELFIPPVTRLLQLDRGFSPLELQGTNWREPFLALRPV